MAGRKSITTEEDNFFVGWASIPEEPAKEECKRVRMPTDQSILFMFLSTRVIKIGENSRDWTEIYFLDVPPYSDY